MPPDQTVTLMNCDTTKSPGNTHVVDQITDPFASSKVVVYTEPYAEFSDRTRVPHMTTNNLMSGSSFPPGLSTVLYTFGTGVNTAQCIIYVYVLGKNICSSIYDLIFARLADPLVVRGFGRQYQSTVSKLA